MFIAHAPFGYILSTAILQRTRFTSGIAFVCAGMAGAVAPDMDLFYSHLIDGRKTHHHLFFTHWPIVWGALSILSACAFAKWRESRAALMALLFSLGGLSHMFLDTMAGKMWWFAPFDDRSFTLISIPARFQPWWLSFVLHWSFIVELSICAVAAWLWRARGCVKRENRASCASTPGG